MPRIFNPIADRLIKEIETDKGIIKKIKPGKKPNLGKLAVFNYNPKHRNTLPYYDTFPASVILAHYPDGFLGINVHYLPWAVRLNLAERLLRATKNKNRVTYAKIKRAVKGLQLPIGYAQFILKRYLYSNVTSRHIYMFEFENYKKFLMDTQPKFVKKSDATVYKLTIAQFNTYAKKEQSDKKPKFTNVKRR